MQGGCLSKIFSTFLPSFAQGQVLAAILILGLTFLTGVFHPDFGLKSSGFELGEQFFYFWGKIPQL
jgi:hypothetical protein